MNKYWTYLKQLGLYLGHKVREGLVRLARAGLAQPRARQLLIARQYRLNIGRPERVVILLVGVGGTGSFCAHSLAQLAGWARDNGLELRLYFVDPDRVEPKNLVRQNFCQAEVGYPKAFTLAWRYSAAFGLTITPLVERFSAELLERCRPAYSPQGTLTIIVGAVDNVCARRDIAEAVTSYLKAASTPRRNLFWIDAGNERDSGQVLIGNSLEPEPLLSPLGYCIGLPLPHLQEPSLLLDRERAPSTDENLSCAELSALGEQSATINRMMASWVATYLSQLLQSRDLKLMNTWLSLSQGTVRSTLISGGRVVQPERPQPGPIPELLTCPECGAELIEGQDEWQGVLINVRFCQHCPYREEGCPECGGEIEEDEAEIEGAVVPVLRCWDCSWREPTDGAP